MTSHRLTTVHVYSVINPAISRTKKDFFLSSRGAYDSIVMSPKITSCGRPELSHTEIARSDEPFKGFKIHVFCWFTISGNGRELVGLKLCEMVLAI